MPSSNELGHDVPAKVAFALLDEGDPPQAALWAERFASDIHLRIGNRPPALCGGPAAAELQRLFRELASLGRNFREVWPGDDGETVLLELDGEPRHARAGKVPIAIVMRIDRQDELVRDLRFYLDPAPLRLPRHMPKARQQ